VSLLFSSFGEHNLQDLFTLFVTRFRTQKTAYLYTKTKTYEGREPKNRFRRKVLLQVTLKTKRFCVFCVI